LPSKDFSDPRCPCGREKTIYNSDYSGVAL
jgi:hypothetical protein